MDLLVCSQLVGLCSDFRLVVLVCPDNASGRVKRAPGPDFAKDPPTPGRVWGQCSAGLGPKPTVNKVLIN